MKRRKTDKAGGYERITVPVDDTRPTCSRCGARASMVDRTDGKCILCKVRERASSADSAA